MNYLLEDNSFIVNYGDGKELDPSLTPIRISLPKSPELELIDGYGLEPEEQYWRRPEMPSKLVQLENKIKYDLEQRSKENKNDRVTGYKIIDNIWSGIESNIEYYREEINWIKKQWYFRTYGYWFFNNGKPTYISPWHYFYLSFWKIEGRIYPEYRDRDRKNFLFWWYCYTTKETFVDLDKDGMAIADQFGNYKIEKMPSKVCFGCCQPKNRRGGITNMSQSSQFENTSKIIGGLAVIFSMTETSSKDLFVDKTVKSFATIPFFFLPYFSGYFDERTSIDFKRPKNIILGDQLNGKITYAKSAMGMEFDGNRITFAIFDESGKTSECQVDERWIVHKQGMGLGDSAEIVGFSVHPSTVEDMDNMGGQYYKSLIDDSNFYQRNPITGQTKSGLFRLFIPSYEGLEGFIDKYGQSVIDDPTPKQLKDGFKYRHGAKKHLTSNRNMLLLSKDPKAQIKYRRLVVKYPFTLDECFQLTIGGTSWNMNIINKRIAELGRIKESYIRGNFIWEQGIKFSRVIFVPNPEGKFELSKVLNAIESNQKIKITIIDPISGDYKDTWMPKILKKGVVGSDSFRYNGDKEMAVSTSSYQSDGGIVATSCRDFSIDPEDKSIYDWDTYKVVAVYRNRPLSEEYNEDVLMCAIYFGYMIYPEVNAGTLWEYLIRNGYEGFLLYDVDPSTGKQKLKPGTYTTEKSKEVMFPLIQNYIEFRGMKENHTSLLKEVAKLKQFSDLNKLDMAAAFGISLLGINSMSMQQLESVDDIKDDYSWWQNM